MHNYKAAFALPAVLITSALMLAVLVTAASAVATTRVALMSQQYQKDARLAAESGIEVAKACLRESANTVTWSTSNPLTPRTNCNGTTVSGQSTYLSNSTNLRTSFRVGEVETSEGHHTITATGITELLRTSNGSVYDSFEVTQHISVNFQSIFGSMSASGGSQTCAIANGESWCWGSGASGRLGHGTTANSNTPVRVVRDSGLLAGKRDSWIAIGNGTACVVSGGQVYCWGSNAYGQLAQLPHTDPTTRPVHIGGPLASRTATQVEVGEHHVCALTSNGEVWCWGRNHYGQLGNGSVADTHTPTQIVGPLASRPVAKLSTGFGVHSICATTQNQWAYCWGDNTNGQLGLGTNATQVATPERLLAGWDSSARTNVTDIAIHGGTSGGEGTSHACAIGAGRAYCWGNNAVGKLGTGDTVSSNSPRQVANGQMGTQNLVSIGVGNNHSCALTVNSQVYCWGSNVLGQSGRAGGNQSAPMSIDTDGALNNRSVQRLDVGGNRGCVAADQRNFCWGLNDRGQIGDGTTINRFTPTPSRFLDDLNPPLYW